MNEVAGNREVQQQRRVRKEKKNTVEGAGCVIWKKGKKTSRNISSTQYADKGPSDLGGN